MRCASWPWKLFLVALVVLIVVPAKSQDEKSPRKDKPSKKEERAAAAADLPAVLWRDPGDISSRDLLHGIGGVQDAPGQNQQYTFVKEDLNGTSTKFYVEDQQGVQWLLKIGEEGSPKPPQPA